MIQVCPERDAQCPHAHPCPFALDRYTCKPEGLSRSVMGEEVDLKPCPFCGGSRIGGPYRGNPDTRLHYFACVSTPGVSCASVFGLSPEQARERWNRRAAPAEESSAEASAISSADVRAALKWVDEVYPSTTKDGSRGAVVEMTWDEFNGMRALIGLTPLKPPRPRVATRQAESSEQPAKAWCDEVVVEFEPGDRQTVLRKDAEENSWRIVQDPAGAAEARGSQPAEGRD